MDVYSIGLGEDFRSVVQRVLDSCDFMLVLIGRNWEDVKDEEGRTRIQKPDDFVRLEIEAALKRGIPVVPVLVQAAHMPTAEKLPAEIKDLAYRNGFELSHNRWESDVGEMISRLSLGVPDKARPTEPDHPSASSHGTTSAPISPLRPKSKRKLLWALLGFTFIILVTGGGLLLDSFQSPHVVRSLAERLPGEESLAVADVQRAQKALGVPASGDLGPVDSPTREAIEEFQKAMLDRPESNFSPNEFVGTLGGPITRDILISIGPMPQGFQTPFERFFLGNSQDMRGPLGEPIRAFSVPDPRQMKDLRDRLGLPPTPPEGKDWWDGVREAMKAKFRRDKLDSALYARIKM
jgi:hypothetical protein